MKLARKAPPALSATPGRKVGPACRGETGVVLAYLGQTRPVGYTSHAVRQVCKGATGPGLVTRALPGKTGSVGYTGHAVKPACKAPPALAATPGRRGRRRAVRKTR